MSATQRLGAALWPTAVAACLHPQGGPRSVLSPCPSDWIAVLALKVRASEDFMVGIDDLPLQDRRFF